MLLQTLKLFMLSQLTAMRNPSILRVPPSHSNRWANYCGRYNAPADPFILCKILGIKMFTHLNIKSIANAAMMEGAMIVTTGAEMMTGIVITTDVMVVQTMTAVIAEIKVVAQTGINLMAVSK